jgi:predicted ester cyclase
MRAWRVSRERRARAAEISTLTEDCVYEVPEAGYVWKGHEGATRFYTELLTAFPDIHFELTDIVIGPQGVCEEARVTATHAADWRDYAASGERVQFRVVIFFPWDRERRLFRGEKVFVNEGLSRRLPL